MPSFPGLWYFIQMFPVFKHCSFHYLSFFLNGSIFRREARKTKDSKKPDKLKGKNKIGKRKIDINTLHKG